MSERTLSLQVCIPLPDEPFEAAARLVSIRPEVDALKAAISDAGVPGMTITEKMIEPKKPRKPYGPRKTTQVHQTAP